MSHLPIRGVVVSGMILYRHRWQPLHFATSSSSLASKTMPQHRKSSSPWRRSQVIEHLRNNRVIVLGVLSCPAYVIRRTYIGQICRPRFGMSLLNPSKLSMGRVRLQPSEQDLDRPKKLLTRWFGDSSSSECGSKSLGRINNFRFRNVENVIWLWYPWTLMIRHRTKLLERTRMLRIISGLH